MIRALPACGLVLALALPAGPGVQAAQDLSRGAYLARIGGCASCHTEPRQGAAFAGGRALRTPFGTLYSTNITPDPRTGIGRYGYDDFVRVMREGTAPGGRHLYPAMPYTAYAKVDEADLRDLFDYLQHGVKAVEQEAPANGLHFPFDQRWALRFWKMAFLPRPGYVQRPERDASWNRGAYLVQSLGHCGSCHTPRGAAYQERGYDERARHFLTGGVNDLWFASNLTGDPGSGLGRFSADALASFLATGHGNGTVAFGTMAEEIEASLQHLGEEDLRAIAGYLKSLPAQKGAGTYEPGRSTSPPRAKGNYVADVESTGAATYRGFCARCHQADGQGLAPAFPRLAGNPSLLDDDATSLIRLLLEGGQGPQTAKGPAPQQMPAFAGTLTDVQMAQVLSFVRQSWGNDARPVTTNDVSTLRRKLRQ
jgi:mono/diheme cytochrome c family protein